MCMATARILGACVGALILVTTTLTLSGRCETAPVADGDITNCA